MSRLFRLLVLLCVLGAADVPGMAGFFIEGADCGAIGCTEGSAEENCTFDCGLCPFCPLNAKVPDVVSSNVGTTERSLAMTAGVELLPDAVPVDVFRPPLA